MKIVDFVVEHVAQDRTGSRHARNLVIIIVNENSTEMHNYTLHNHICIIQHTYTALLLCTAPRNPLQLADKAGGELPSEFFQVYQRFLALNNNEINV